MKLTAISKEQLDSLFTEDLSSEEILDLIWPHLEDVLNQSLDSVESQLEEVKAELNDSKELTDTRLAEIQDSIKTAVEGATSTFTKGIQTFKDLLSTEGVSREKDIAEVLKKIDAKGNDFNYALNARVAQFETSTESLRVFINDVQTLTEENNIELEEKIKKNKKDFLERLEELRQDVMSRLGDKNGGGGSISRNIAVSGNSSVLSMYTDINLIAGPNITMTYTNNNVTKYTDVTIAGAFAGSLFTYFV